MSAAAEHVYKFDVKMTCEGCSGAVTRALSKLDGVTSFDVSLEKQEVLVRTPLEYQTVYDKIAKTGKEIRSGKTVE